MSLLNNITQGVSFSGIRAVIAGQEKVGKTTISSQAPNPLLIPLEVGFAGVTIAKVPMIQKFDELTTLIAEITQYCQQGSFPYKTLILDSATALERLIHEKVLSLDPSYKPGVSKTVTMESAHGGYGKAYTMANTEFDNFLKSLDVLAVYFGINIVLTAHVFSSKIVDPTSGEYDSWDLLLHSPKNNKTYGKREMITQWADLVGFMYEPIYVMSSESKGMVKGVSQNKGRVLAVSRTPAYTAGNRFGLTGEIPMPAPPENAWNHLAQSLYNSKGLDFFTRN
jgi:hypothetical protein